MAKHLRDVKLRWLFGIQALLYKYGTWAYSIACFFKIAFLSPPQFRFCDASCLSRAFQEERAA